MLQSFWMYGQERSGGGGVGGPVMVGGGGIVAPVHLLKEATELGLVQVQCSEHARLLRQVVEQQGEGVALCGLRKCKNVKLPAVLRSLQAYTIDLSANLSVQLTPS